MSRCKHGKLKHPKGRRRCKLRGAARRTRGKRRGRHISRRAKGGIGLLTLGVLGAGGYLLWSVSAAGQQSAAAAAPPEPPNITVTG